MPGKPVLIDTLAVALAGERNYDRAIETHKSAIKLAPESGSLKLNLAKTYLLAGDKGQARKELETIKALGSKFDMQDEVAAMLKSTE